jgi:Domain of unknown function (DUF222)
MFESLLELTDEQIDARCAELELVDPYEPGEPSRDHPESKYPNSGVMGMPDDAAGLHRESPGSQLRWLLERMNTADVSDYGLVEVIAAWERMISYATARQAEAIAELADRPGMQGMIGPSYSSLQQERVTAVEIGARLSWSTGIADHLVDQALLLTEPLSATRDALLAGRITTRHARVIADELGDIRDDPALAGRIQERVLAAVDGVTPTMLRSKVKRTLARLAPDRVKETIHRTAAQREVTCRPAPNGMAFLDAYLPAADATAFMAVLDAAAAAARLDNPDDQRTLPQLRADALAEMGWTALATGYLTGDPSGPRLASTRQGHPVTVNVTVALTTLLGLDEQSGELAGYGPIDAETARRLATAGTWRRLITDPQSGAVLDVGRTTYRPPADLADHVIWRDRDCVAPGCSRSAESCQLDHTVPYPEGATAASNLGLLCRRHHLVKHHTRWRLHQPQPGQFEWTSPTGHRYLTTPQGIDPILADEDAPPPSAPTPPAGDLPDPEPSPDEDVPPEPDQPDDDQPPF